MPRITAPSVAEHRVAQRRAILDAARAMLTERPDVEPTFGEIAARAGLSRPSIYTYFASRDELLIAVAQDLLPEWKERIYSVVGRATDPVGQVVAYADANLGLIADGEHALIDALGTFSPTAFSDPTVAAMHGELVAPLLDALRAMHVPSPEVSVTLVNALVHKAGALIAAGENPDVVRQAVRDLLG